jgi:hypothetical protein
MGYLLFWTALAVGGLGIASAVPALTPLPESTERGWNAYVAATQSRVAGELASSTGFLASDFEPTAADDRAALASGQIVIRKVTAVDAAHRSLVAPDALVHDWRGSVLIPGLTLARLVESLQRDVPDFGQQDVLAARTIDREGNAMTVFLRVQRTKFVTVVYDTTHVVHFQHESATRVSTSSVATRIVEVTDAGTPAERDVAPGQDHGYLWRWNAYWRYEETPNGVIAECESVSLSREVPVLLRFFVGPMIESVARESVERTLSSMRAHFGGQASGS